MGTNTMLRIITFVRLVWRIEMNYFMYVIASIILFNLLVLAFITWKIGLEGVMDLFFTDEETSKDMPLERTQ